MPNYRTGDDPRLSGNQVFGVLSGFTCARMSGAPATIDAFLGNPTGTAQGVAQSCYACAGLWVGTTSASVQAQIDALTAMANVAGPFGYPTTLRFPDDFRWAPRWCYFLPSELVASAIVAGPGGTYQATYKLVLRELNP